jgi:hypothetical protein
MTEQELAAPSEAADEATVSAETGSSEATENTEGQVEGQPAEGEESPEEKSKSKARRERREAAERRAKEEADEASRKLRDAQERLKRIEAATTGRKEPRETDYDDPLVYASARALWLARNEDRADEAAQVRTEIEVAQAAREQAEQMRLTDRVKDFAEAIPEARARYADFDQVIAVAQRADVVSPSLSHMILESETPHDLAYHLGKNPELARTLSAMHPVAAARELGRIEAKLNAPRPKTTTTAPDPISPVRGTASGTKNPERMTPAEWRAAREAGWKP